MIAGNSGRAAFGRQPRQLQGQQPRAQQPRARVVARGAKAPYDHRAPAHSPLSSSSSSSITSSSRLLIRTTAAAPQTTTAMVAPTDNPAAAAAEAGAAPPPPEPAIKAEPTAVLKLAPTVTLLRSRTHGRLKLMVEYSLRKGSTDNCYLVSARAGAPPSTLIDVPFPTYKDEFMAALRDQFSSAPKGLATLTHFVSTHLGPNRVAVLADLLEAAGAEARAGTPDRVRVVLTNPGLKVLEAGMAALGERGARLLGAVEVVALKAPAGGEGVIESVELGGGLQMRAIVVGTPRWPDAVCMYDPQSQVLFTGQFFSAHVAPELVAGEPAGGSAFDGVGTVAGGGWDAYGEHWRYFFDCMLAPVPTQASAALGRLPVTVSPLGAINARVGGGGGGSKAAAAVASSSSASTTTSKPAPAPPTNKTPGVAQSFLTLWSSAMFELTRGAKGSGGGAGAAAPPSIFAAALAPTHGPCVRACLSELVGEYGRWAEAQVGALKSGDSAAVMYASAYGNTTALALAIARGITKAGVAVRTLNLEDASLDEVAQAVRDSDAFVLGSPTLGGHMPTQVSLALGTLLNDTSARALPAGVFGSFGWSGEAVDEMEGRLRDGGFRFAFPSIRVKFRPTAQDLVTCEQAGRDLAVAVRRRRKAAEKGVALAPAAAAAANSAQLAVGRVVGSLCVVTACSAPEDGVASGVAADAAAGAAEGGAGGAADASAAPAPAPAAAASATGAMLASWVSQASFDPPGITVAVKKDRAMEPLLMPGAAFALSVLAEGRERSVVKALARPFAPGADRLAALDTKPSDGPSGAPVLADALATLDCRVQSRMEAGDHYVLYAVVEDGKLRAKDGVAAVHHRKVGNHY
jgi:flavorubredoxin/flavin reductase (DIM6/NTAB) family NADH-FMN oxidoreductase RutF